MSKHYIKGGVPISDLYETVNELSGMTETGQGDMTIGSEGKTLKIQGAVQFPKTTMDMTAKYSENGFYKCNCTTSWVLSSEPGVVLDENSKKFIYFTMPANSIENLKFSIQGFSINPIMPDGRAVGKGDFAKGTIVSGFLDVPERKLFFKGSGGLNSQNLATANATTNDVRKGVEFFSQGSVDSNGKINKSPLVGTMYNWEGGRYAASTEDRTIQKNKFLAKDMILSKVTQSGLTSTNIAAGKTISIDSLGASGNHNLYKVTGAYTSEVVLIMKVAHQPGEDHSSGPETYYGEVFYNNPKYFDPSGKCLLSGNYLAIGSWALTSHGSGTDSSVDMKVGSTIFNNSRNSFNYETKKILVSKNEKAVCNLIHTRDGHGSNNNSAASLVILH